MSIKFCHLHVHSHYSLLDGLGTPQQIVLRAKEMGMDAVAITDHGAMYGAIEFYKAAKAAGIKPIIGMEAYVAPRKLTEKVSKLDSNPYHLILLAKNLDGYLNLMRLSSIGHLDGFYYKPRVDKETLKKYSKGLIATSACLAGELPRMLLSNDEASAEKSLSEYKEIFGEDFYIELQDHPDIRDQGLANEKLIALAKKTNTQLVVACDAHYIRKEDREAHDVLVCVQIGKTVDDPNRMTYDGDFSLRDPKDLAQAFKDVPQALENTRKIADQCELEIPFGENLLPEYKIEGKKTPDEFLRAECLKGLPERYPELDSEAKKELLERLDYELSVIAKMGFSSYFLIVADYVKWAKENGIMVGPGRGSAAGAIVTYLTYITDVDPIRYGLLFERFLNPDRLEMPDIDLDFADHRRGEVLDYIVKKYGEEKVAGIITFGTMAARAAVRDVGRALGMPYAEVDQIAKVVPPPMQGRHVPLEKSVKSAELGEFYSKDPRAKRLLDMAMKLEGTVRHAGQHASAFVITQDELVRYVPLQQAQKEGVKQVTQYSMYPVAELGLLKMDFLGLSNLTTIERALDIIEAVKGEKIDIFNLPTDDKKTFELLARAETTGVFQFECLSGDTIVSNTTIKNLYEQRHKKVLESVYLDEGKVHKNKILGICKSGKKEVFSVVAENGWFIKASAEHKFLTENGWKKLRELKAGDRVLIKNRAKHLVYSQCSICSTQIDGQKEGKAKYCHRCAAFYYKNPSKLSARKSMSAARAKFFEQGGETWNKGKNKENNAILAVTGKKISQALLGRTYEDLYGPERAKKYREQLSQRMKGKNNHMFGRKAPHRKGGFRQDLGHYVRSNWEADFARVLIHLGLEYQYEPTTFSIKLRDGTPAHYTPDFYVEKQNTYYEIKGWMHDLDREKLDAFSAQYPAIKLEIISATRFAEFALKYRSLVKWECPQIPVERSFGFMRIEKIVSAGIEETYDIAMQEPGNNFVANGFVVHNSSGMKRYIKELKPTSIDDVAVMVALYRPGPMQFIDSFIKRKSGREEINYPHEMTKVALEGTYGIPVYQEQVMQISKDMAGFTGGEADKLRKAMGKKIAKLMAEMKEKFVKGSVKNGVSQKAAEKVFSMLEDFAAYGFNKSHAVCYAMIAYQTAYLKAHHPECFMAALLTSDLDDTDRIGIEIEECGKMGIEVLPPDVNESFVDFGVVKETSNIRFGLAAIKGIGETPARIITRERKKNGPFKSLEDFIDRMINTDVEIARPEKRGSEDPDPNRANSTGRAVLNKKILESLAKAGGLDNLAERNRILQGMEIITKRIQESTKQKKSAQIGLFGEVLSADIELGTLELPEVEPATQAQRLAWEKEHLGIYLSEHPLKEVGPLIKSMVNNQIGSLTLEMEGKRVKIGGILSEIKKINTRSGQPMAFAKIEDLTGKTEILVFPRLLADTGELWASDTLLIVEGKISTKDNEVKILADKAEKFDPSKVDKAKVVTVSDEDEVVEIDLSEEPEVDVLEDSLAKAFKDGKMLFEKEGEIYVILTGKVDKEKLLGLKELFEKNPGDKTLTLAYKKNGNFEFKKTKVLVSSLNEKDIALVLG